MAIAVLLCCMKDPISIKAIGQEKPKEAQAMEKFKVRTDLVEVHAVVTDRKGRIIENLKKEDFDLLENNRPQEISFFSLSKVKDEQSRSNAAVDFSNMSQQLSEPPARTTLLYVDNLHLSFSSLTEVKKALNRFIDERMTGQDMMALATSRGTLGIAQQFTRDRRLLHYGVEQISLGPVKRESFFTPDLAKGVLADKEGTMGMAIKLMEWEDNITADYRTMCEIVRGRAKSILAEASYSRRTTLSTLKDLTEQMIHLPGQRMIAIWSDGFTMLDTDLVLHLNELQPIISRASRSGIVIYSIDAKGLQAAPTIDASIPGFHGDNYYTYKAKLENLRGLYTMAEESGGKLFQDSNDLSEALVQAFDANKSYYVLAYYLHPDSDMHKFRNIKVRIRNHPEYSVRAPRGFMPFDMIKAKEDEAAKTPQQRLLLAVNASLPATDLGVSVRADFMETETDDKHVSLRTFLEGNKLQYREQDQHHLCGLEILYVIYDSEGKRMDAHTAKVEADLTPEGLTQAQANGYLFLQRLALKPGVYQARVGVRETETNRIGTATAWIDVPELTAKTPVISSLMFRDPSAAGAAEAEGFGLNKMDRGKMMQGIRLYAQSENCSYFLRVYRGTQASPDSRLLLMREFLQGGVLVKEEPWAPISLEDTKTDSKGWFDVKGKIDLAALNPGLYEMRIHIKENGSQNSSQRTAIFGVE